MRFGLGFLLGALVLMLMGCATRQTPIPTDDWVQKAFVESCIDETIELYGDLCAESSTGYETMDGTDAHEAGAFCAAESIRDCVGDWSGGL